MTNNYSATPTTP